MGVSRGSSRILNRAPEASFIDSSSAWSCSDPERMVRNFMQGKGSPPMPGRSER